MDPQDPQDAGPGYRNVVGLPGGVNSPFFKILQVIWSRSGGLCAQSRVELGLIDPLVMALCSVPKVHCARVLCGMCIWYHQPRVGYIISKMVAKARASIYCTSTEEIVAQRM